MEERAPSNSAPRNALRARVSRSFRVASSTFGRSRVRHRTTGNQEAWVGIAPMASSAPLATSHTAQRSAGGSASSPAQTASTSPDEYHTPHAAVLLRDRREGGGTGLRCQGWPSFQPPERTHSRAAVMARISPQSAGDAGPEGRGRVAGRQSMRGMRPAAIVLGGWELAATLQACRRPEGGARSPGVVATRRDQRLGSSVGHGPPRGTSANRTRRLGDGEVGCH